MTCMNVRATFLVLFCLGLPGLAQTPSNADHAFDTGSGIQISTLTSVQVDNLATLGRVWGFLKYHHPEVTSGKRNWDYDLFRILPGVLAAPDSATANEAMLRWIDALGPVPSCRHCVAAPKGDLDLKPPIAWIDDRDALGAALSERLEQIYKDRSGEQFYVARTQTGNAEFGQESMYGRIAFPDFGYQLLALYRWWNIMQYWAPDREVAEQDWDAVLKTFIPKIALAPDKDAYTLAMFELIATANDTHANLWTSMAVRPPVGECAVPVVLRIIDDKPVVFRPVEGANGLQAGDVLEKIDGAPVSSLIEKWAPYYADSNEAARQRDLAASITRGACGPVSLEVTRVGKDVQITAERVQKARRVANHDLPGDTFQMLSPAVAYVKLSSIKAADLAADFEKAQDTKGLIVDIRNYPSDFMPFAMGAYLAERPAPFVSFTMLDLANPGAFHFQPGPLIEPGPKHYKGRVIILVDEISQSQAEYTAMALRAMPHAVVVGSTTAGADGDTSKIPLPGGLSTIVSGLGVFYPNHRPTQRVGIVPDLVVRPTVEGIAAGRDEVLEAARHLIETGAER